MPKGLQEHQGQDKAEVVADHPQSSPATTYTIPYRSSDSSHSHVPGILSMTRPPTFSFLSILSRRSPAWITSSQNQTLTLSNIFWRWSNSHPKNTISKVHGPDSRSNLLMKVKKWNSGNPELKSKQMPTPWLSNLSVSKRKNFPSFPICYSWLSEVEVKPKLSSLRWNFPLVCVLHSTHSLEDRTRGFLFPKSHTSSSRLGQILWRANLVQNKHHLEVSTFFCSCNFVPSETGGNPGQV